MGTGHPLSSHQAPKQSLQDSVSLRTPLDIASFVSTNGTAWSHHLRELNLDMGTLECRALVHNEHSVAADALLELLRCPVLCLHTLRLGRAEELLSSSQAIRAAFQALPSLKHLTVCDVGPATVSTVSKMSSKMFSVTICNIDPALDPMASSDQVIAMLAPFSDTLEEISLVLNGPCNFTGPPLDICFPHVRRLSILSDSCRLLASSIHAFPNVEVIQHNLSSTPHRFTMCQATIDSFVRSVCAASHWWNMGFSLSSLTECSSDLLTLRILRPALVPLQKLRICGRVHDMAALLLVSDVLAVSRPAELELCVEGLHTLEGVVSWLVNNALGTLRTLRIDFSFSPGDHNGSDDLRRNALARLMALVDDFPPEVPSFDLLLDLESCFGRWAAHFQDRHVQSFRHCLASSTARAQVLAPCSRRIIPVQPVYTDADDDIVETDADGAHTDCEEFEDDFNTESDQSDWSYLDRQLEVEDRDKHWLLLDQSQDEVEEDYIR